jgi:hypothetical protein
LREGGEEMLDERLIEQQLEKLKTLNKNEIVLSKKDAESLLKAVDIIREKLSGKLPQESTKPDNYTININIENISSDKQNTTEVLKAIESKLRSKGTFI